MPCWTRCGGCTSAMADPIPPEATPPPAPPFPQRLRDWWTRLREGSPEEAEAEARKTGEVDALIEEASLWVERRHLETPAILFLETHKPLSFLGSQLLAVGTPAVAPLFGIKRMEQLYALLEKGENVERLIRRIEERVNARESEKSDTPDPLNTTDRDRNAETP